MPNKMPRCGHCAKMPSEHRVRKERLICEDGQEYLDQPRSSTAEVRNPIAALPAFADVQALPLAAKKAIKKVYYALAEDCAARAEKAWATSKGPMALYYKTRSVECRHIARGIKL